MPTNTLKNSDRVHDFKAVRRIHGFHLSMQLLLSLTLAVLLNYIAAHHYFRIDLTENRKYTLSPETKQYLLGLEDKVMIYVLMPETGKDDSAKKIRKDISNLLREYAYASTQNGQQRVNFEFVDIYQQRAKSQELAERFKLTNDAATIIIECGNRYREVSGTDLYVAREGELIAFKGESVFTESILDVANKKPHTVYFLTGHGEMRVFDADPSFGLSQFILFLKQRNIRVEQLDLNDTKSVPDDASLVLIVGAQRPIEARESDALRNYLSVNNGKLIVFLKPGQPLNLDDLFYEWGILADNMAVQGIGTDFQSQGGDLIIRNYGSHPITEFLIDNQLPLIFGRSQSVRPDPGAPNATRNQTTALLASAGNDAKTGKPASWAKPYWATHLKNEYNAQTDLPGPVSIAALSQHRVEGGLGLNIPGGKLIVFGNSDFVSNNYFQTLGNSVLINNTVNWCLERNAQLNVPPKPLKNYKLTMSRGETQTIFLRIALIPLIIGCLGIVIIWLRRR